FRHDGGEVLFHLPNGLLGYLQVDGRDGRVDEGPVELLGDPHRTSGTARVVTGLSCLACHDRGLKGGFKDTVRDGTALAGEAREKVRALYPAAEAMNKLVEEDTGRFRKALDRATGELLRAGGGRGRDLHTWPEPIGALARPYLLREMGPEEAALELGLPDVEKLQSAIRADDHLRQLGLGPLAVGGTIKRETWASLEGF